MLVGFRTEIFSIPNEEFKILLIGKDGGIKFEGENRTLNQIFDQIDSMPMRRYEMQFDSC